MQDNKERISATGDLAFKKVFGTVGNEEIIAGLANDFFGISPDNVRISNPYNIIECWRIYKESGGNYTVLKHVLNDVAADLVNGDFMVECQVRKQYEYEGRALFYPFKRFCDNYDRFGNKYRDLKSVFALNILKESFYHDELAVRIFRFFDDYAMIPMSKEYVTVGVFELMKREGARNRNQEFWRAYFLGEKLPESAPEYIKKAERVIEMTNLCEEERYMLALEEKYRADQFEERLTAVEEGLEQGLKQGLEQGVKQGLEQGLEQGVKLGLEQGRKEGAEEKTIEFARKLKSEGAETALIVKVTGLSEQDVDSL